MKRLTIVLLLTVFFILMLLFPTITFEASKKGLILWFDTLLPTLLPFLIISQLMLKTSAIEVFQKLFAPFITKLFHCSLEGAFCILCGLLCGCPVGARLISLQIKEQRLSKSEGQYLLSFCNQLSPSFCISYGILQTIGAKHVLPYLMIIYGTSLLYGYFTRPKTMPVIQFNTKKQTSVAENIFQLIDVCIIDSFLIMIKLCGYLILFSLITQFIVLLLPSNSITLQICFASFLEITGGLSLVQQLPYGTTRTLIALSAFSFGGLCCVFQTNSVLSDSGISLKKYIFAKALITLFVVFFYFFWNFCFNHFFTSQCWC